MPPPIPWGSAAAPCTGASKSWASAPTDNRARDHHRRRRGRDGSRSPGGFMNNASRMSARRKISFENRLALFALMGGLPATLLASWFVWRAAPTVELRVALVTLLFVFWISSAFAVRRRVISPLNTVSNLIEAIRYGDYTLRGRRAGRGDALGEVVWEINALGDALQKQRLASLEANALVNTVLEELDAAVLAFDESQRVKLLNRAAADLLGRSPESLLGRSASDLGLATLLTGEGIG